MNKHQIKIWSVLFLCSLLPLSAYAQEEETPPAAPAAAPAVAPAVDHTATIDALKKENQAQQAQMEQLKKKFEDMEAKQAATEAVPVETMPQKKLDIYGFMDLSFFSLNYDSPSTYDMTLYGNQTTFTMANINLYVSSQLTEKLNALFETRYTWSPQFDVDQPEVLAVVGGKEIKYKDAIINRGLGVETLTQDNITLNGLNIVRAQMAYSFNEFFNIVAGRYLTPYGIWNTDHASTVIMTARLPYLTLLQIVPQAQTGLYAHGRFFPTSEFELSYALTVSNGRGPNESMRDLDANKAVGLRLKAKFENDNLLMSVGGYGFMDTYTNIKPQIVLDPANKTFSGRTQTLEAYDEQVLALDLLLQVAGFTLQSEYVRRRVDYTTPTSLDIATAILYGGDGQTTFNPNYLEQDTYGLISYELPLKNLIGSVRLIPYFMYEYSSQNDVQKHREYNMIMTGLNIRPNANLTLKAEYSYMNNPDDPFKIGPIHWAVGQMAMSF